MKLKTVPSAGPWITKKEINFVHDACANGWYENMSSYTSKFENKFSSYIGAKFSLATSSCTGALHIILKALGISEGDEVIVPEVTWIATVSAIYYLGATPIFCDIEKDTWCICPKDIKKKISKKTKAIIPVHMYGHPANMKLINNIAKEFGIKIVEDAAPGLGSKIENKPVGTFGIASAFSFQGAKPITTGEGGMICTNDENLFDKIYFYWDHARDKNKTLFNSEIGLKYKMSNIQAALGYAQISRIDKIINKRRKIYFWYKECLSTFKDISINIEKKGYFNNFYVPTIIFNKFNERMRDKISFELINYGVNNRPFFRPISKMLKISKNSITPNADFISARGINLPCATILKKTDVIYTCKILNKILSTNY